MSILKKIAYYQGRRDEVPNQQLARELARTRNADDIREIATGLWELEPNVRSDCLKVLYELGYIAPELIAGYAEDFLRLLAQRNNRLVWGGMIALSAIASLKADIIFPHADEIIHTMETGSIITNDAGMRTLCALAAKSEEYRKRIFPYLIRRLRDARAVDAPRYAEFILDAAVGGGKAEFIQVLEKWIDTSSGSRLARLRHVRKMTEGLP